MEQDQLEFYIRKAKKIFVWLQLSEERAFYVKTTKAALLEYLTALETPLDEAFYLEFGEETGELYLGRPPE